MGLSFLNKKPFHPGTFKNMREVWLAEQREREKVKKAEERRKRLKEERLADEMKQLQINAGLLPASNMDKMEWMYTGGPQQNANTIEELWNSKPEESIVPTDNDKKKKLLPVISESYANPDNEIFTKLHEDPLVAILKEEQKLKEQVLKNPQKMKEIQTEIDTILKGTQPTNEIKDENVPSHHQHHTHHHHAHKLHHHHHIHKERKD